MGLVISAISSDFSYNVESGKFTGRKFINTDISYERFFSFREKLIRACTSNKLINMTSLYKESEIGSCYAENTYPYKVLTKKSDFSKETLANNDTLDYLNWMSSLKEEYPKLYSIYGFLFHDDCGGEIDLDICKPLLTFLKEIVKTDTLKKTFDSVELLFIEKLIMVLEKAVLIKGKLLYT